MTPHYSATVTTISFEAVISTWNQHPQCEARDSAGAQCGVRARYHVTCHECGRGLVCDSHLQQFREQLAASDVAQCNRCGRKFACIDDAITVVEL